MTYIIQIICMYYSICICMYYSICTTMLLQYTTIHATGVSFSKQSVVYQNLKLIVISLLQMSVSSSSGKIRPVKPGKGKPASFTRGKVVIKKPAAKSSRTSTTSLASRSKVSQHFQCAVYSSTDLNMTYFQVSMSQFYTCCTLCTCCWYCRVK